MASEAEYRRAIAKMTHRIKTESKKSGKEVSTQAAEKMAQDSAKRIARRNND